MKINQFYLIIGLMLFVFGLNAQTIKNKTDKKPLGIYLFEFDHMIYPKKFPDTIVEKLDDTTIIKLYLNSAKGAASFFVFDLQNQIRLRGKYADALDIFKRYVDKFDKNGDKTILIQKYYEPIATGEWIYYSNKGIIIKKVNHFY